MKATIQKWGNSQVVQLPKTLLESLNLSDNDTVDIVARNGSIIIKKTDNNKKHMTIEERFKDFNGRYEAEIVDWGAPVGDEIW